MQIDIGFGDAVYPEPELASFPVLLQMEAPLIRAYHRESAVAENARTGLWYEKRDRFYLAVPATSKEGAALWVYAPED